MTTHVRSRLFGAALVAAFFVALIAVAPDSWACDGGMNRAEYTACMKGLK